MTTKIAYALLFGLLACTKTACTKSTPELMAAGPSRVERSATSKQAVPAPAYASPYKRDADGRTILAPVTEGKWLTRIIYVSSSGKDGNSGLTEKEPMRSPSRAVKKLRPGYPDHVLLKRGDTFEGTIWLKGVRGLAPGKPAVIGAYGEGPRPKIRTGRGDGVGLDPDAVHEHLAIVSLDLAAEMRDPAHPEFKKPSSKESEERIGKGTGINATTKGGDILIEDCLFSWFGEGMTFQQLEGMMGPVELRRNVIHHIWALGMSQGLYTWNVGAQLIEDNVIDQIGYLDEAGVPGTMFSHAMYLDNMEPGLAATRKGGPAMYVIVRGNLVARADGVQARDGGFIEDNLFWRAWIALMCGGGNHSTIGGTNCFVRNNVILDGGDINPNDKRGWGIWLKNLKKPSLLAGNVLAHSKTSGFPVGISIDGMAIDEHGRKNPILQLRVEDNVLYKFRSGILISGAPTQMRQLELVGNVVELEEKAPALTQTDKATLKRITADGNRWFSGADDDEVVEVGGELVSVEDWAEDVRGAGGAYGRTPMADPGRDLERYAKEVAKLAGDSALIDKLHDGVSGPEVAPLRPRSINAWLRKGFERK